MFDDIHKFKRKSNAEQYKINAKVMEKIEIADSHIETQDLSSAREAIIEGKYLININPYSHRYIYI